MRSAVLTMLLGLAFIFTNAQAPCDIATGGVSVVNSTNTGNISSLCVGQTANFRFFAANLGTSTSCTIPVNTVTIILDFPGGANKPYQYNGPASYVTGFFTFTYDANNLVLVGRNTMAIPNGQGDANILVPIIGLVGGSASSNLNISQGGGVSDNPGNNVGNATVVVNALPTAAITSNNSPICSGSTASFTITGTANATVTYNINNAANTTVLLNSSGTATVTVMNATANQTLNLVSVSEPVNGCSRTLNGSSTVTVTAPGNAGTLSGTQGICVGSTTQISTTGTGGTYSSSNAGVASVDANSGLVTGVSAGTANIIYTVPASGGCPAVSSSIQITVTAPGNAGTLSATPSQNICVGGTTQISTTGTGGTYSSSDAGVASVDANSGVVTGVSAGQANIIYTVPAAGGCPAVSSSIQITVTAPGNAGTLSASPSQNICVNGTTTVSTTGTGGTYSSSDAGVASVDANSGVVTGVSAGQANIIYTVAAAGGCPAVSSSIQITVTAPGNAGTLSATPSQNICVGGTTTVSTTGTGGTYSSSDATIASVTSGGVVTGVSAGTANIIYTVPASGGCPAVSSSIQITVTAPGNAGTLSATPSQNICVNGTTTVSTTGSGGTYSSSNAGVASVDANSGVVTGVSAGQANIIYTVPASGGCPAVSSSIQITVTAPGNAGTLSASPSQNICVNGTTTVSTTGSGGTYSSSNAGVASVDANSGLVTGVSAGQANIIYTVPAAGGCPAVSSSIQITVTAPGNAGTLSGTQGICVGGTTQISTTGTGGTYSSSAPGVASVDANGLVTGVSAGQATISYTVPASGGCPAATSTILITVTAAPNAGTLGGNQNICVGGTTTFSTNARDARGGTFTSDNTGVATVEPSTGVVTGVAAGTATITYTVAGTGGCADATATRTVTVTAPGNVGTLSGTQAICVGGTTQLTTTGTGGTYSSSDAGVASVDANGLVTGVSAGQATISYTVAASGGCPAATSTILITVSAPGNAGTLSGTQAICSNGTTQISTTGTGGTYSSSAPGVAAVDANGLVTGVSAGQTTISYTVPASGGCPAATSTIVITVTAAPNAGMLGGNQNICVGGTTTFSTNARDARGGTFTSDNTGVATVDPSTGVVTGVAAGQATITYTVTGTGGCADATATRTVTVTAPGNAGTLSGTQGICVGSTTQLTTTGTGGTYSSSDPTIASVNANTGLVTGVSAGQATISYTVPASGGCPAVTSTLLITVTAAPVAGTLSGTQNICVGGTTTFTVSGNSATGTFTSSNPSIASVDPSTGVVTGVAAGQATITYTVAGTGGCADATATRTVTVNALPTATIAGNNGPICSGSTASFTITGTSGATVTYNINGNPSAMVVLTGGTATVMVANATANQTLNLVSVSEPINGCSQALTGSSTVTVTANNTITLRTAAETENQTVCISTPIADIVYNTTGATGATVTGLPAGVSGSFNTSNNRVTISGTPTAAGTFNYTVTLTGGCGMISTTGTINVTPNNTITLRTAAETENQTVCISTPIADIVYNTTGATGATVTGLPAGVSGSFNTSNNRVTISGTPTAAGTFNYTVTLTGGCGMVSATGTITVIANNTVSAASSTPTVCINTALPAVTHTTTGATGISNDGVTGANGLPAGVSATFASNTITISGTPTAAGTFNYSIPLTGGCGMVSATGTITVIANNTITLRTAAETENQTVCISTPIADIIYNTSGATGATYSGLPSGVNGSFNTTNNRVTISGTPTVTGTFNYTVTLTGGCGMVSASGTITVNPTLTPTVNLSANPSGTICAGTPVMFTATASNTGGGTVNYNFKVNGNSVQNGTSNMYTSSMLMNGDQVNVDVIVAGGTCLTTNTATSSTITMVVNPTPTGSISGTTTVPQNSATNSTITFTGSGGTTPYIFTYSINGGSPTSITTMGANTSATVIQSNAVAGTYTYTLLSITSANGCSGTITPPATATVTVTTAQPVDLFATIPAPISSIFVTTQQKQGYVQVNNNTPNPTSGVVVFRISKVNSFTLLIPANMTTAASTPVNNTNFTITDDGFFYTITSTQPVAISGNSNIKIGFTLTATGGAGTSGIMTVTILDNTGGATAGSGDTNNTNNQTINIFNTN